MPYMHLFMLLVELVRERELTLGLYCVEEIIQKQLTVTVIAR